MAKIVLSTLGSLGDLHPKIALGLELKARGHDVVLNTWEGYREKLDAIGLAFCPMRPDVDQNDRELLADLMHPSKGPEKVIRELVFPYLDEMYADLVEACDGADLMVTGELIYVAKSVAEKTNIKWVSTSLAPLSMFSSDDPNVYPQAEWLEVLRPLPSMFHRGLFGVMRSTISHWYKPYKEFRRRLDLDESHDPMFTGKFSSLLHLALFSRVLAMPQPDWWQPTVQTGFCFYDGQSDTGQMPDGLEDFLNSGVPPIVFTLGSAAVLDPRDFFDESVKAAKLLKKRAVVLYGNENPKPAGLMDDIVGFPYAPFSRVFPKAACVIHQGGVGTTGQVLRAGVPHLIMPYSHDQPDNAARCRRIGVARKIGRERYNAKTASAELTQLLNDPRYRQKATEYAHIVNSECGTAAACDAIESALIK
jgi:UDP:flavonoid glycosyltransferase YjiC (YdhE family)